MEKIYQSAENYSEKSTAKKESDVQNKINAAPYLGDVEGQFNEHCEGLSNYSENGDSSRVSLPEAQFCMNTHTQQKRALKGVNLSNHSDNGDALSVSFPEAEFCMNTQTQQKRALKGVDLKKRYKCKECPKSFARVDTLLVHRVKVHTLNHTEEFTIYKEGRCYCKHCPKTFTCADTLILHMLNVHKREESDGKNDRKNKIKATYDEEVLGELESQFKPISDEHIANENSNDSSHNSDNAESAGPNIKFNQHMQQHSSKKPRRNQNSKNRHKCMNSITTDDGKFNLCFLCGKGFPWNSSLKAHMTNEHSGNKGFNCIVCGKSYRCFCGVVRHIRSTHGWFNCLYRCEECEQRFIEKAELLEHLEQHLIDKSDPANSHSVKHNQLPVCDKVIEEKDECTCQPADDATLTSRTCTKCKKCFVSVPDLRLHLKIHEQKIVFDNNRQECSVEDTPVESFQDTEDGEKSSNICGYYCEDCPKILTLHYYCPECPKIFCYDKTLKQHIARLHPERVSKVKPSRIKMACSICGMLIMKACLKAHMSAKHAVGRSFSCSICGQGFIQQCYMKYHMIAKHSNTKPCMCSECGQGFNRLHALNQHIKYFHGAQSSFSCAECGKVFTWPDGLRKHMKNVHNGLQCYSCAKCGQRFTVCGDLEKHMEQHPMEESVTANTTEHICKECGEGFGKSSNLKSHMKTVHQSSRVIMCSQCGQRFSCSSSLKIHIRYVHGLRRCYGCGECGHQSTYPYHLRKHFRKVHNGLAPCCCAQCGHRFTHIIDLKKHIEDNHLHRSQNNIGDLALNRKYTGKCAECGETFAHPADLKDHMATIHPEVTVYMCNKCGQTFAQAANLKMHMIYVHSARNCYCCPECGKHFTYPRGLRNHMKEVHHGLDSFSCAKCGHLFAVIRDLEKHIAQYHQKKPGADMGESLQHVKQELHNAQSEHSYTNTQDTLATGDKQELHNAQSEHSYTNTQDTLATDDKQELHNAQSEQSYTNTQDTLATDDKQELHNAQSEQSYTNTQDTLATDDKQELHNAQSEQSYTNTQDTLATDDKEIMAPNGHYFRELNKLNDSNLIPHACIKCKKSFECVPDLQLHLKACLLNNIGNDASGVSEHRESFANNETTQFHNIFHTNNITETLQNETREGCERGINSLLPNTSRESFNCIKCEKRFTHPGDLNAHMTIHDVYNVFDLSQTRQKPPGRPREKSRQAKDLVLHDIHMPDQLYITENQTALNDNISEEDYVEKESNSRSSAEFFSNTESVEDLKGCRNIKLSRYDSFSEITDAAHLSTDKSSGDEDLHADILLYTCLECDQRFSQIEDLQDHQNLHCVYKEDVSGDALTFDTNLADKSIEESLSIQIFNCLECGEKFTQSEDLQNHKQTHADEKTHADETSCRFYDITPRKSLDVAENIAEEKPITCAQCKESFTKKGDFNKHIETHITAKSRHLCKECGKCYKNKAHLRRHMLIHTGSKPHCCEKCGEQFYRKDLLQYHDKTQHSDVKPPRPLLKQCSVCPKKVRDLELHMAGHQGIKVFVCSVCEKHLANRDTLKAHMLKHTGHTPYQCEVCGRGFALQKRLKAHMQTHEERKSIEEPTNHVCDQCGRGFLWQCQLKQHMQTHTGLKPHVCTICGKRYAHSYNLTAHMDSHTDPTKHTCQTCGQICASATTLHYHMKRHSGIKPHICRECDRTFVLKSELRKHQLRHTGVIPHACTQCQKRFVLKSELSKHELRHSGIKQHECTQCQKRFTMKSSLDEHMRRHSGLKPHECSQCEKKFTMKADLHEHMQRHSGIKPHACSECHRKFTMKSDLCKHMQIHSGEVHSCPVCYKNFVLKRSLKRHMLKNH